MHHLRSVSRHAVNWRHPGNRDLRLWLYGLPGRCGGGQWRDLTGRHTGTLTGGPTWVPTGRGDLGIAFDASNDYVAATAPTAQPFIPAGASPWAVSVWVRRTTATGYRWLVYDGDTVNRKFLVYSGGSGDPNVYFEAHATAQIPVSFADADGEWRRVCVGYDGTNAFVQINGGARTTGARTPTANVCTNLSIGGPSALGVGYWGGSIADVQVRHGLWTQPMEAADYAESQQGYPGRLRRVEDD